MSSWADSEPDSGSETINNVKGTQPRQHRRQQPRYHRDSIIKSKIEGLFTQELSSIGQLQSYTQLTSSLRTNGSMLFRDAPQSFKRALQVMYDESVMYLQEVYQSPRRTKKDIAELNTRRTRRRRLRSHNRLASNSTLQQEDTPLMTHYEGEENLSDGRTGNWDTLNNNPVQSSTTEQPDASIRESDAPDIVDAMTIGDPDT